MSVTAGVFDAGIPVRDRLRGKLGKTKVPRYRPGRAPEWTDNVEEDSVEVWADDALGDMVMCDDSRQAEVVKEEKIREVDELKPEEENEYALEANRMRTREKLLSQMRQEDAWLLVPEEEEEEESEYEEDSGDDELGGNSLMMQPVFVAKEGRLTTAMQERLDAMELSLTGTEEKRKAEMKEETKKMVVEEIKKNEENIQKSLEFGADVDTDDEVNAADEYKAWMMREVPRIKRDRETREVVMNRAEEKILESEDRSNPRQAKRKWRLMQVYYHKGAFFQSDADDPTGTVGAADIYLRDFSAPTGEDKMDKTILPKVMQVKRFGRTGRTKWTHLVNEDTTDWNSPWTYNDSLSAKCVSKMDGMKAISKR